jgi:hypothetical protein
MRCDPAFPIGLTDHQLRVIMTEAKALPPRVRSEFLTTVVGRLPTKISDHGLPTVTDIDVMRAIDLGLRSLRVVA